MKENKIRKRVKKLLSVTLTASMLVPSMSYGTIASAAEFEITAPDDEFTDGAGQGEEVPANEAGVNEDAINVFSDGNLSLAVESSNKHTVIIDTKDYTIGSEWMVDLTNNHDGTITISSAMPEFKGSNKNLRNAYKMIWTGDVDKPYTNEKNYVNPENENGNYWKWSSSHTYDPVYTPINIKPMLYTIFMAISEKDNYVANIQNVESPVRVIYSLDGGTGGPKEDWVWNLDGKWNSDHHKIPTREGYQFTGWYMDNGTKIETVAEAVANAEPIPTEADGRRKEIELKAHWIPIHEQHYWNYISDKNIIKAYCSRTDTQCKYYADSKEHASNYAVLELGLNVSDKDNIIYSGNPVEAEIKTNTITITGATEGKITYKKMNKDTSEYIECNKPVDAGMYKAEVTIGDDNNNATASIEYEIKKATIGNFNVSLESFPYGSPAGIQLSGEPEGSEVTYQYKVKNSEDSEYKSINEEALKTFPVGEYTLKATVRESVNYEGASATCDFKVTKADISSENSKVHISDWIYGSYNKAEHGPSVTNPGNGKVSYTYYTDADCKSPTTSANSGATVDGELPKNVGTYYVKAEIQATDNYNSATAKGSFKIEPKEVTVKPNAASKHIGKTDPELTYTADGLVTNEELTGITLTRETGEGSGTYKITATEDKNANPNYKVKTETGIFTIIGHSWSKPETKIKPTTWSEGKEERTCTVKECGQKRYDTIPKTGESRDEYADRIEKYVQGSGTEDKNTIREATLNNKETQLLDEINIFGADENTKIKNHKATAKVWIELTSATLTKEQEDAIRKEAEKFAGTNVKLCPFDMNLFRQMDGENEKQKQITDSGITMNIRFRIPDDMINNQSYTIRNYKIIRLHNGTTDILDTSFNSSTNEITFETNQFSAYALTYKDTYYSPSYPVTGIKVSPDTLTLTEKDETAQLTAEVTPSYADNKRVTWKSSDEKVVTVDENGKVTAVANGTATITATSVSGNYTATVSVTVKIPVEIKKITIETEKETLTKIGESTELKAKIAPENADPQKLTWKSSDEKVAIVDENGKVTAVANGTATITVTTEDGKHTASVIITVNIPDEPVISNTTGFGRLKARSTKQTKTSVTLEWSRIDDADGYFIYGSRCNTSTKSYKYKKLATITNGKTRTWTQKDLKKGTYYKYVVKAYKIVNGKKVVTDTSASIHTVTQGGKYGVAKSVSVTKIGNKKNVTKFTLKKGKTAQITAKEIKKDNRIKQHRNLCYESSNTKVATVTSKGLIRAVGKGTCTIWVYAQNGVYKALTITVK